MKSLKNKCFISLFYIVALCFSLNGAENNPLVLYDSALELEAEEKWFDAAQNFHEVTALNPSYSDAWFHLASCSYKLGEFELALSYLEQAERLEKNKTEIQNLKGMLFLALGKTQEASDIFHDILKRFPNNVEAHFGLAEIELYDGKFAGAEQQYTEALKRQNTNRKALLSLALVCAETERYVQSEKYMRQAMQYYSGECEVHYLAAVIYYIKGDFINAEKQARIAVELNGNFDLGYELLSSILYSQARYNEVIDVSDFLISRNRNNVNAWYLKGIAQNKLGNDLDAIDTWDTGLSIEPQDEVMRTQLELAARENLTLNDDSRKQWSDYHLTNAVQYETRFDKSGALYEYQRALLLNPKNVKARLAYADIIEMNGMHELYLEQMDFIKQTSPEVINQNLSDKIDGYKSLIGTTLAKKWDIDSFYLDKIRWNIAIFYTERNSNFNHSDLCRLTALACGDVFSGVAITSVKTQVTPVSGYAEAFKNARISKFDYFILVSPSESEDDMNLKATMYSGNSGTEIFTKNFYATGNNRFSTVLRRFRNAVLEKLTVRGKILARNGKTVLVDLGRSENIVKDSEFKIIRRGGLKVSDTNTGLTYKESDVVGTLVITNAGEEVSEAEITNHGFYDRINIGDEILLVKVPEEKSSAGIDTVPNSAEDGKKVVNNSEGENILTEIKKAVEKPAIVEMLRSIY